MADDTVPTTWAYEQACAARAHWQERAERAEAARADDYKRGYDSGYHAGLTAGQRRAEGRLTYRRQYWRCASCGKVGMVLFRGDDDAAMKQSRLDVAHAHRGCQTPHILRLTPSEAEKWTPRDGATFAAG